MDLAKVLEQLHRELRNLDAAILSLERLQQRSRRRGRPPSWLNRTARTRPKRKNHPGRSDDGKERE